MTQTGYLKTGEIVGKFRIERLIGRGGMGEVYEATHHEIGRKVAIKRLHPDFVGTEKIVERFFIEAQAAGSIGHDNICHVEDVGTFKNAPYLVMPLLIGETLSANLKRTGQLSVRRAVDIACQTLSGLHAAHSHPTMAIVHRDLKPENIFLTRIGRQADFVKILDFGIAKVIGGQRNQALLETNALVGTGPYMAPEQAKGVSDIDQRVDIYTMGVILYETLTGKLPFWGDNFLSVIAKIQFDPFDPPTMLNPDIPQELESIIIKAMSRDRNDRYATAQEMLNALEVFGGSGRITDVETNPPSLDTSPNTSLSTQMETHISSVDQMFRQPSNGSTRNRGAVWIVSGALLMGGAGVAWMLNQELNTQIQGDQHLFDTSAASKQDKPAQSGTAHQDSTPDGGVETPMPKAMIPVILPAVDDVKPETVSTSQSKSTVKKKRSQSGKQKPDDKTANDQAFGKTVNGETSQAAQPKDTHSSDARPSSPPQEKTYEERGRGGSLFLAPSE